MFVQLRDHSLTRKIFTRKNALTAAGAVVALAAAIAGAVLLAKGIGSFHVHTLKVYHHNNMCRILMGSDRARMLSTFYLFGGAAFSATAIYLVGKYLCRLAKRKVLKIETESIEIKVEIESLERRFSSSLPWKATKAAVTLIALIGGVILAGYGLHLLASGPHAYTNIPGHYPQGPTQGAIIGKFISQKGVAYAITWATLGSGIATFAALRIVDQFLQRDPKQPHEPTVDLDDKINATAYSSDSN